MSFFFDGSESSATSILVDGVQFLNPWCTIFNLNPILIGGPRRPDTGPIAGKEGEKPFTQFWAPQGRRLQLDIHGEMSSVDGHATSPDTHEAHMAMLITNIRWARLNLLDRVAESGDHHDGTRLWVVTWRDGIVEQGRVQVVDAEEIGNEDGIWSTIGFDVILPDGPLTPVEDDV